MPAHKNPEIQARNQKLIEQFEQDEAQTKSIRAWAAEQNLASSEAAENVIYEHVKWRSWFRLLADRRRDEAEAKRAAKEAHQQEVAAKREEAAIRAAEVKNHPFLKRFR